MSGFSLLAPADFQAAAQRLLPRGRAWTRRPDSVLAATSGAVGDAYAQLHAQAVQLLDVESDPARATELLPDWEFDYGLPDPCTPANPSLTQRRAAVLAKIAAIGGQSASYFIGFAAALGYTITITTWVAFTTWSSPWQPVTDQRWRFAWQVNAPSVTVSYFTTWSSPWDPLWQVNDPQLECRMRAIAPSYGVLWFQYG